MNKQGFPPIKQGHSPIVNTPQFPGMRQAATPDQATKEIEAIRDWIRNQKRAKGFEFTPDISNSNEFNLPLSGTARFLLGFAVVGLADSEDQKLTLTINNEIVIENVGIDFFKADFTENEYYFFPRPLSGQDTIVLNINSATNDPLNLIFYYI